MEKQMQKVKLTIKYSKIILNLNLKYFLKLII